MTHSPELREFVAGWEELRLIPYEDMVGVWTNGYGHVLLADEPRAMWTEDYANEVLDIDLEEHGDRLQNYLRRDDITQNQYDAILSLAFNCGVSRIGASGLVARFNLNDDDEAADRFLKWNRAGGQEVRGLTKRRRAERNIFLDADYSGRP